MAYQNPGRSRFGGAQDEASPRPSAVPNVGRIDSIAPNLIQTNNGNDRASNINGIASSQ